VQGNSYKVVSYKIRHSYDVSGFLLSYRNLLQRAVDMIWSNIKWIEKWEKKHYIVERRGRRIKRYYRVKRLIPVIPKAREFKRQLRNMLLENWECASHYVDSAIKVAYSILKSWRRNYIKGRRRRRKPVVKRLFARIKKTLYVYRGGRIRVTIDPGKRYLEFDLSRAWFKKRVEGLELGELILTERELVITFRKPVEKKNINYAECIGWDSNKYSLDGFSPKYGWVRIGLGRLYHIHRAHELKRKKAQSVAERKRSVGERVKRHGERERNRARDYIHKLTTLLTRAFPNTVHGFEDLDKTGMFGGSRERNREISKQNWKQIIRVMGYKGDVRLVNPRGTSKTCPLCGGEMEKLRRGRVVRCTNCGLELDRQLCGAMNIYLRMCGFPPSPSTFYRKLIKPMMRRWKVHMKRRSGVTTKGGKGGDRPPMNPRRWLSLMNPKAYIGT